VWRELIVCNHCEIVEQRKGQNGNFEYNLSVY
jgi:hypothetical protein